METNYVLINESDESIIEYCSDKDEAIKDADMLQSEHKFACYIVCECIKGVYNIDNYIFKSSELSFKF